jgi:hypothetical protein
MNRINARQACIIAYVAQNPGCTKWSAAKWDHTGPGHRASYAAIDRLIDRGLLRVERHPANKGWTALYVPAACSKTSPRSKAI